MTTTAVELEAVSKRYRLGEHHGAGVDLRETLVGIGRRLRRAPRPPIREVWPLRDITLSVAEGQSLGIIGRNGAGKSTLLKVVSHITEPTAGRCRTRGRVGSLLEVGTGFHGELTGLENTYLNGAILGMSRREIAARLDEIVSFAGLERFMDTPVKRYSSGMFLRLGFAIAAHMEAEVLVVDEVLAVGDAEFQRRCLGKMREVEQSGRTVLFVSHDLDAVARLCSTVVWLDDGKVRAQGPADEVIGAYLRPLDGEAATAAFSPAGSGPATETDAEAYVARAVLLDGTGDPTSRLAIGEAGRIVVDLVVNETTPGLNLAVIISNARGTRVIDESVRDTTELAGDQFTPGAYRLSCPVPSILSGGSYTVTLWLGGPYDDGLSYEQALAFTVGGSDDRQRAVRLAVPWEVSALRSGPDDG